MRAQADFWFWCEAKANIPEGTGYQIDLYRMDGVPDGTAQRFEQQFMSLIDSHASDALGKFIAGDELWAEVGDGIRR